MWQDTQVTVFRVYANSACIPVNICNSDVWTWYYCVPSIHVIMAPIYEMTVSSELVYLCIGGTWIRNISVTCNSICVMVIHVHEMTVSLVTEYPSYGVLSVRFSPTKSLCNRCTWMCNSLDVNNRVRCNPGRVAISSTRVSNTSNYNNDYYILNTVGTTRLLYIIIDFNYQFIG